MDDRVRLLLLFTCFVRCVPGPTQEIELCPEGTIATTDGCARLPDWNPWAADASVDAGEPTPKDAAPDPDAGFEPDAEEADAGEPSFDPSGIWALRVVNAQTVTSQLVEAQAVIFVGLSIVRIDRALGVSSTICSLESSPFGGTTTTWSPQAIAAITLLRESAGADELAIGKRFTLTRTQILGWRGEGPADALPNEAGDWRVYDADNDDNPGVTLQISGAFEGEMYVVSRSVLDVDGTVTSADHIEGPSTTRQEQNVIGASNDLLALAETTAEPIPEMSSFEMIRAGDTMDCALLIQTAGQLFMDP